MKQLDFIQVGVGNRGTTVLRELQTGYGEQFRPVALVDINPDFLTQAQAMVKPESVDTFPDLAQALTAHPDADAVVVVTPAHYHYANVRLALGADKHVWVEKPLTYSYAEAQELASLAQERGREVVVGNQYQYSPLERRLQQMVQSGVYGAPYLLTYVHHRHRPEMRAFTGVYPALWEQGVHSLDSMLAILGHPPLASVYALGQRPAHSNYNSDTATQLLTQFHNGLQAYLLVTFDSQRTDWEIRVECAQAALRWQSGQDHIEVLTGGAVTEQVPPLSMEQLPYPDPYAAFYAAITQKTPTPTAIGQNLRTIQWIDAAVRSLQTGEVIRLQSQGAA